MVTETKTQEDLAPISTVSGGKGETSSSEDDVIVLAKQPKRFVRWGIILIIVSGLLFGLIPLVPFLPVGTGVKFVLGGVIYGFVQLTWWVGAALAGPEVIRKMRRWVIGRFKR